MTVLLNILAPLNMHCLVHLKQSLYCNRYHIIKLPYSEDIASGQMIRRISFEPSARPARCGLRHMPNQKSLRECKHSLGSLCHAAQSLFFIVRCRITAAQVSRRDRPELSCFPAGSRSFCGHEANHPLLCQS